MGGRESGREGGRGRMGGGFLSQDTVGEGGRVGGRKSGREGGRGEGS